MLTKQNDLHCLSLYLTNCSAPVVDSHLFSIYMGEKLISQSLSFLTYKKIISLPEKVTVKI